MPLKSRSRTSCNSKSFNCLQIFFSIFELHYFQFEKVKVYDCYDSYKYQFISCLLLKLSKNVHIGKWRPTAARNCKTNFSQVVSCPLILDNVWILKLRFFELFGVTFLIEIVVFDQAQIGSLEFQLLTTPEVHEKRFDIGNEF